MHRIRSFTALLTGLIVVAFLVPSVKGRSGARERIRLMRRVMELNDAVAELRIELWDGGTNLRVRRVRTFRKEDPETGLNRYLIRFLEPEGLRGTGLLILELPPRPPDSEDPGAPPPEPFRPDEQYLYIPALDRIRRIAGGHKRGAFMGSQLTYEDLESRELGRDLIRSLPPMELDGELCQRVESTPRDPESSHARRIDWFPPDRDMCRLAQFYDREDGELRKEMRVEAMDRVAGRWVVTRYRIRDVRTGHETRVELERVRFDGQLPNELFTRRSLEGKTRYGSLEYGKFR